MSAPRIVPKHIAALAHTGTTITTSDGAEVEVWELQAALDEETLAEWAHAFRQHYCADAELDQLCAGTGLSRKDYLRELVFPDSSLAPGPSIRAGDFAELLIADYVEHVLGYWVPRGKYASKAVRNESVKGVDIVGFKWVDPAGTSPDDLLLAFEVKAQLTDSKYSGRLQVAIDDSAKDMLRRAETLNAIKQRLLRSKDTADADRVQRFQNMADSPYQYRSGAAAVLSIQAFDANTIASATTVATHPNRNTLQLLVVRGVYLMRLAHALYEAAADAA
jgi:hypothetical protein